MSARPPAEHQIAVPAAIIAGTALVVIAIVFLILAILQLRADALEEARRNIANLALVLSEQTARVFQVVDLELKDLQDRIAHSDIRTAEEFRLLTVGPDFHFDLRQKALRLTQTESFAAISAHGRIINSSRADGDLGLDVTGRDYFTSLKQNSSDDLFVSAPTLDRSNGKSIIVLGRRVMTANGTFLGIFIATFPLQHFEEIYSAFDLPHGESFLLVRRDGTVLVRHPDPKRRAGETMPDSSPWFRLVREGGGFYISPGYFDNVPRMVAVRPLREYPIVVNAAVSELSVLKTWRKQATLMSAGTLIILSYASFLMLLGRRSFVRVKTYQHELRTILETMDQGLLMVDGHGIVVQCNPQARDLLDLPSELTDSKPLFFQVLTYQWEHNKSGREDGNFEQFCHKRLIVDRVHSQELIRPDGRIIEVRSVPLKQGGFVRTYTDITIRKGVEAKVAYLAHHDDLTKLANRAAFQTRLEEILAMSKYLRAGAIMYLDLDRFKEVNDKCGHEVGDKVLVEVARRMQLEVRATDTVSRLGGDEFAILLPNLENQKWCADLARRLCVTLGRPYFIEGQELFIGSSVGIALFPQDGREGRQLLQRADHALYEAKRAGRNTFRFWTVSSESRMSA